MVIRSAGAGVLAGLAVNAPPDLPPSVTAAGPALARKNSPGTRFSRCSTGPAARDFADVYVLARRFGKDALFTRATQTDAGFDATVLAGMMAAGNVAPHRRPAPPAGHRGSVNGVSP